MSFLSMFRENCKIISNDINIIVDFPLPLIRKHFFPVIYVWKSLLLTVLAYVHLLCVVHLHCAPFLGN